MNNQTATKKLSLRSETIRTLDTVELGDVNGGTWGPAIKLSLKHCGKVYAYVKATKWAQDHQIPGNPNNPPSVVTATA
jgi:hypothetical protein